MGERVTGERGREGGVRRRKRMNCLQLFRFQASERFYKMNITAQQKIQAIQKR